MVSNLQKVFVSVFLAFVFLSAQIGTSSVSVQASNPSGRIVQVEATSSSYERGDQVAVEFRANNDGPVFVDYRAVVNILYPNGSMAYDTNAVGADKKISLNSGSSQTVTFYWTIPSGAPLGTYKIDAGLRDWSDWDTVYDSRWGSTPADTFTVQEDPPVIQWFYINDDDSITSSRTVTLNNSCTGNPTHYMASESSSFYGAMWESYSTSPSFTLSSGFGNKTVYFKVKNAAGEGKYLDSDTIEYIEPSKIMDVEVTSVSVSDSTPCPGDTITVSYTVRSNGNVDTGVFTNSARWSTNSTISLSDTELNYKNMSSISPGSSRPDSMTVTIPSGATIGQTYYIGIYADSGDVIAPETSDSNNGKGTSVTIQSCDQPELYVSTESLDFNITYTSETLDIRNTGGGMLTWEISEDYYWLSVSPNEGSTTSETDTVNIIVTVDPGLLSGIYTGTITITSNGGTRYIFVSVSPPFSEPVITSVTPNSVSPGVTLRVFIDGINFNGAIAVSFGSGIIVDCFSQDSSTQITALITIDEDAIEGWRDISIITPGGTGKAIDGLQVKESSSNKYDLNADDPMELGIDAIKQIGTIIISHMATTAMGIPAVGAILTIVDITEKTKELIAGELDLHILDTSNPCSGNTISRAKVGKGQNIIFYANILAGIYDTANLIISYEPWDWSPDQTVPRFDFGQQTIVFTDLKWAKPYHIEFNEVFHHNGIYTISIEYGVLRSSVYVEVFTYDGPLPPTVVVTEVTLPGNSEPSQDLDGDGIYGDVNGDGQRDNDDVVTLFENIDSHEVWGNTSYFDFNGNGRIDFDDIIQLSKAVTKD